MIEVSFIVAIYNIQDYLRQCLDSVLPQLNDSFELILVDDGSTDESSRICDEYALKKKNIVVVHKQNGGLSDARNVGIKTAKGKYIAFIDGDDFVSKGTLTKLLDSTKINSNVIIYPFNLVKHDSKTFSGAIPQSEQSIAKYMLTELSGKELWPAWKIIVKRDFIMNNNLSFPEKRLHEDVFWTSSLLLKTNDIKYENIVWYNYVDLRLGSITNSIKINNLISMLDNFDDILKIESSDKRIKKLVMRRVSESCFPMLKCLLRDDTNINKVADLVSSRLYCFRKSTKISHKMFCLIFRISHKLAFKLYLKKYR